MWFKGVAVEGDYVVSVGLTVYIRGQQIFRKCRRRFKILGYIRVTWNKFHTENPQMLCTTGK